MRSLPFVLLLASTPAVLAADATAIRCGSLFDATSGKLLGVHTVLVSGERIESVTAGDVVPDGAKRIDLGTRTCLPGLIDLHVHLTGELGKGSYLERYQLEPADHALRGSLYAKRTLEAGFTTVRNLGDDDKVSMSLRNAINQGYVVGPRIYTAGASIGSTGGHADHTTGMRSALQGDPGPEHGIINGADDAVKAVRQRYKDGADVIKLMPSGGVLDLGGQGENPQMTIAEIKAAVETARDYGFVVGAHAHGKEAIRRAILGGVDSIEHGTFADAEIFKLMKEHGTWLVPTVSAGEFVAEKAKLPDFFPAAIRPKAAAIGPQIQGTLRRAYEAGVKIAFGTDTGVSPHGQNAHEFELMVGAGMPAAVAIQAATVRAAELLKREKDLGSLAAGRYADVIAVDGDPVADVARLKAVAFVMKGGTVYKQP